MLEKPELPEAQICAHLWQAYGCAGARVEFLPLGADVNTAVYRVVMPAAALYFLKLRKGGFESASVEVPHLLHRQGLRAIIPPIETLDGRRWGQLAGYTSLLYPFIEGRNGFEAALSEAQWFEFGATLKGLHTLTLPPDLQARLPRETYSPLWRNLVRQYQAQVERQSFADPLAAEMAAFMRAHRSEIGQMVQRAEALGNRLQAQPPQPVVCHADIHAGNLLLAAEGAVYLVDWDTLMRAPKEHDLMFIGGGVGGIWNSPREDALFYRGYGAVEIQRTALAYYRYERIVQDIAAYCEQILASTSRGEDRAQGLGYFTSNFLPGGVLEIARQTEKDLE